VVWILQRIHRPKTIYWQEHFFKNKFEFSITSWFLRDMYLQFFNKYWRTSSLCKSYILSVQLFHTLDTNYQQVDALTAGNNLTTANISFSDTLWHGRTWPLRTPRFQRMIHVLHSWNTLKIHVPIFQNIWLPPLVVKGCKLDVGTFGLWALLEHL
jgi:hypothetical protein